MTRIDSTADTEHWQEQAETNLYYLHTHINGAPKEMTGTDGQTVWQARYKTWGRLSQEDYSASFKPDPHGRGNQPLPQNLRFQGQYYDEETGLHYNTFRYYDPDVGRFTTEDPIGLNGGENLYAYGPNPFFWIDPWGLAGKGGRGGGADHARVQNKIRRTTKGTAEGSIDLGNGRHRAGDVVEYNKDGSIKRVHQIGDMRTRGGKYRPSARERGAIEDIRKAHPKADIVYHDKRGKAPSLINPDKQSDWKKAPKKHRHC